jgi:multidrug efflux pump subunit AcrA (membrane-fusion protein)
VRSAEADAKTAAAAVELAKASIAQRQAEVAQATNVRAAKLIRYERYQQLLRNTSVTPDAVDEAKLEYLATESALMAANAALHKAKAEQTEKRASAEAALADIDLKKSLVEVARRDRDAAATLLGYARVYAPFDGVVVQRNADPGKFVANATTGASDPLVTVARVDLVTVAVKLPDSAAAFVTPDTEVVVEFAQLPGVTARGPVTRFSPAIDPTDRTMRVEVDVYNGTADEYRKMLGRSAADSTVAALVPNDGFARAAAAGAGLVRSRAVFHKGWHDGNALTTDRGGVTRFRQIAPGAMANVRVSLDNFTDARLLPSGAVFSRSGQPYLPLVENGVTRAVPVAVQVNDGRLVKAAVIDTAGGKQLLRELTGDEVIVASKQVEVGDGAKVTPVPTEW